jgi:TPR repeat protein
MKDWLLIGLLCPCIAYGQNSFKELLTKANQGDMKDEIAVGDAYNYGRGTRKNGTRVQLDKVVDMRHTRLDRSIY